MKSLVNDLEEERSDTNYSELLVKKRILEQELEDKNRALIEIIKEETNIQRPGGSYSRSYLIAYYAMKAYQSSGISREFKSYVEHIDKCREIAERNGKDYSELLLKNKILEQQLEIAKEALKNINVHDSALSGKWVSEYELRDIAKQALEELESAGE